MGERNGDSYKPWIHGNDSVDDRILDQHMLLSVPETGGEAGTCGCLSSLSAAISDGVGVELCWHTRDIPYSIHTKTASAIKVASSLEFKYLYTSLLLTYVLRSRWQIFVRSAAQLNKSGSCDPLLCVPAIVGRFLGRQGSIRRLLTSKELSPIQLERVLPIGWRVAVAVLSDIRIGCRRFALAELWEA